MQPIVWFGGQENYEVNPNIKLAIELVNNKIIIWISYLL